MTTSTLLNLVGNTPLVELTRLAPKPGIRIFAKLEGQNPSGSIKDRIALAMVEQGEREGFLRPGGAIVEASSGNTAIALALVGKQKGYPVRVIIPGEVAPSIGDLLDLYIVTGTAGTGRDDSGTVYRIRVDVPGLPVPPARVALPVRSA